MQNTRTNELVAGNSFKELEEKIAPEDRGPRFAEGNIVTVTDKAGVSYRYRVSGVRRNRLFLKPHGPATKEPTP